MDTAVKRHQKNKDEKSVLSKIYSIYHSIAEAFLYTLLIMILVVFFMLALYFIDMETNIKSGKYGKPIFSAYVIISPSMYPTIKVEDAVVVKRKNAKDYKVGDIITFLSSDSRFSGLTITHRIVGIEKGKKGEIFFRTKGDNNNTPDNALVKYDNIFGKVLFKIPKVGYIKHLLSTSFGWILLIVIPCLGIVIYDIMKAVKSISKKTGLIGDKKEEDKKEKNKKEEKEEVEEDKEENDIDYL